jgi:hypothetical protein
MERAGLYAWFELPIWLPSTETEHLDRMRDECLRIVRQYRQHRNVIAWTAGCELSQGIDPAWRESLVREIQELTGHPMIKDNSGGAEMYGGHPLEFGTFEDFHPYCEPMFYPSVVASLSNGPQERKPALLGEFNDYDQFRPVHQWVDNPPYWASDNMGLNEQGVRWQYDLPKILHSCRQTSLGTWLSERSDQLAASSLSQATWMRGHAFDAVRLNGDLDGWVLTGHRHTPISSSGIVDDSGEPMFPLETLRSWTADDRLILFPRRTPPFVLGGNRPSFENPCVRFAGPCLFQVALHSIRGASGALRWRIEGVGSGGCQPSEILPGAPREVGRFVIDLPPGRFVLEIEFGLARRTFDLWVVEHGSQEPTSWLRLPGANQTLGKPFFREACYAWEGLLGWRDQWEALSMVAGDRVLDPAWLDSALPGWKPVLTRLDTRTFDRHPVVAVADGHVFTTLRPGGGLGVQPIGVEKNPAGVQLLRDLKTLAAD